MHAFEDIETLTAALRDLGGLLAERDIAVELCIVGGAAFLMQEPTRFHSTMDIDVAARVTDDGELTATDAPPDAVVTAANELADRHGLRAGWINGAMARSFGVILPQGFLERASQKQFGSLLIHVAARDDLIKLKLLASMRRGPQGRRHRDDLRRAGPTSAELAGAVAWVLAREPDPDSIRDRVMAIADELEGKA